MMHLICHFLIGVIFTMKSFITIKSKFMGPILNIWGNSMLCCELVDSLLKFPSLNIRSEFLECDFHRAPIHAARSIP